QRETDSAFVSGIDLRAADAQEARHKQCRGFLAGVAGDDQINGEALDFEIRIKRPAVHSEIELDPLAAHIDATGIDIDAAIEPKVSVFAQNAEVILLLV